MKPENCLTVAEAARKMGRSSEQVRRYLRQGKLAGQRVGQQWFIPEAALEQLPLLRPQTQALIRRIQERRAAIRASLEGDLPGDLVQPIRADRDEH